LLILDGTLRQGDTLVVGSDYGRVRQMLDDQGGPVKDAGPAMPVQMLGLSEVPAAGERFHVVENERVAKQIVSHRQEQSRATAAQPKALLTLEDFLAQAGTEGPRELAIVLKTDVHGTGEAIREALEKLSTDMVTLNVLSAGVGGISENDIMLAKVSNAIVVGFHVRPDPASRRTAEAEGVDVRLYQVIMDLVDDMRGAMAGLLPPTVKEVVLGQAEVRELFTIPRIGSVAGSYVTEGLMRRNSRCRLIRDGIQIYEGKVGSLRRFKEDVREVQTGFECGLGIEGYQDVKIGDVIESYDLEEHPATL
jgi:translation initiation factor IF-2